MSRSLLMSVQKRSICGEDARQGERVAASLPLLPSAPPLFPPFLATAKYPVASDPLSFLPRQGGNFCIEYRLYSYGKVMREDNRIRSGEIFSRLIMLRVCDMIVTLCLYSCPDSGRYVRVWKPGDYQELSFPTFSRAPDVTE